MNTREFRRRLLCWPQHPAPPWHPRVLAFHASMAIDFPFKMTRKASHVHEVLRPFPKQWESTVVSGAKGAQLRVAFHRASTSTEDFGVIVVPGMFAGKNDHHHRGRAIRYQRKWNVPVACYDPRGQGESTGDATAGWLESEDLHHVIRFMRDQTPARRFIIVGESMGGATVLRAATEDPDDTIAGVIAFSPFLDPKDAVDHISTRPAKGDPFRPVYYAFRDMLRRTSKFSRFDTYLQHVCKKLGLSGIEELYAKAEVCNRLPGLRVPALLLASLDDHIVPARHVRSVERNGHPTLVPIVLGWGNHGGFDSIDPEWTWSAVQALCEGAIGKALPPLHRDLYPFDPNQPVSDDDCSDESE